MPYVPYMPPVAQAREEARARDEARQRQVQSEQLSTRLARRPLAYADALSVAKTYAELRRSGVVTNASPVTREVIQVLLDALDPQRRWKQPGLPAEALAAIARVVSERVGAELPAEIFLGTKS